jgi:hypothetical protein
MPPTLWKLTLAKCARTAFSSFRVLILDFEVGLAVRADAGDHCNVHFGCAPLEPGGAVIEECRAWPRTPRPIQTAHATRAEHRPADAELEQFSAGWTD